MIERFDINAPVTKTIGAMKRTRNLNIQSGALNVPNKLDVRFKKTSVTSNPITAAATRR
jgi:hypothetical protein